MVFISLEAQTPISITILHDENRSSEEFVEVVKKELNTLLGVRYQLSINAMPLNSGPGAQMNMEMAMSGDSDLLITLGFTSSDLLSSQSEFLKPCIAGISLKRSSINSTGIRNFNYIQSPFSLQKDIKTFKSIFNFKKLGIFVEPSAQGVKEFISSRFDEIDLSFVDISDNPLSDIQRMDEEVDAVYILPNLYNDELLEQELIDGLNNRGLPTFSLIGRTDVEKGVLASIAPSGFIEVYARRLALSSMKILEGTNASELPIQIDGLGDDFVVNMNTMRELGIYPPLDILSEASFVDILEKNGVKYSLRSSIAIALENNLSILAVGMDQLLQDEEVGISKANLLPNIDGSSSLVVIDEKSAESLKAANQLTPQRNWNASIGISQLIYSEPALANVSIQKSLLRSEELGIESRQLDLILDVASAYFRFLQAQANATVQNTNVETTLKNLRIAQNKAKIGSISLADVYGLESQLASNKISLNDAMTNLEQAAIAFNQLLNRPLDESFVLEDLQIGEAVVFVTDNRLRPTVNNQYDIRKFSDFLVEYCLREAPEIEQLKVLLEVQKRTLLSEKRSRYLPQVAVQANIDKTLGRYGVKTADELFQFQGVDPYKPTWNLGVNASMPIFQGFSRNKKIEKSKLSLKQVEFQKYDLEQQFELNVRLSLENLGNSFNAITYATSAEESSQKFLAIIQDLYKAGATNINTLLDAQNTAVSASLNVNASRYQFFIDAITIERLVNKIYITSTTEEKDTFMDEYFNFLLKKSK